MKRIRFVDRQTKEVLPNQDDYLVDCDGVVSFVDWNHYDPWPAKCPNFDWEVVDE